MPVLEPTNRKTMTSRGRHAVLSLTTRFCLPHEGMTHLEFLSRGSAAILDVPAALSPPQSRLDSGRKATPLCVAVMTCQHVACPWLFPRYFADKWDWLQFVSEEFVQHSLQLLSLEDPTPQAGSAVAKPEVLLDLPLAPQVHIHSERDLALLTLDGAAGRKMWEQAVSEFGLQSLTLQSGSCSQGEPLLFSGHRQLSDDEGDEGEGFQAPKAVAGHFVGRSARGQEFAWSREVLEEGMCGGAVFGSTGECVGIVEGIVPPLDGATDASPPPEEDREALASWQMKQALANHVAFIPSSEVCAFIAQPDDLLLTGMDLPPNIE